MYKKIIAIVFLSSSLFAMASEQNIQLTIDSTQKPKPKIFTVLTSPNIDDENYYSSVYEFGLIEENNIVSGNGFRPSLFSKKQHRSFDLYDWPHKDQSHNYIEKQYEKITKQSYLEEQFIDTTEATSDLLQSEENYLKELQVNYLKEKVNEPLLKETFGKEYVHPIEKIAQYLIFGLNYTTICDISDEDLQENIILQLRLAKIIKLKKTTKKFVMINETSTITTLREDIFYRDIFYKMNKSSNFLIEQKLYQKITAIGKHIDTILASGTDVD